MIGRLWYVRRQTQAMGNCEAVHDSVDVGEIEKENGSNIIQSSRPAYRTSNDSRERRCRKSESSAGVDMPSGSAKPR
jgi:hypothetical protein